MNFIRKKRWILLSVPVILILVLFCAHRWIPRRGAMFLKLPTEQATKATIMLSNVQGMQTYSIDGEILSRYLKQLDLDHLSLQFLEHTNGIAAQSGGYLYQIVLARSVETEPFVYICHFVLNDGGQVWIDGSLYQIKNNQEKITEILQNLREELQQNYEDETIRLPHHVKGGHTTRG